MKTFDKIVITLFVANVILGLLVGNHQAWMGWAVATVSYILWAKELKSFSKPRGAKGLIVDEETGQMIAAYYNKADAPIIASAPELLEALRGLYLVTSDGEADYPDKQLYDMVMLATEKAKQVLNKVDGRE